MPARPQLGAAVLTACLALTTAACGGQTPGKVPDDAKPGQRPLAAKPAAAAAGQGFTLAATGDVLPHDSIIRQALADAGGEGYDFSPMLAGVEPVISQADLAICHMETVYGEPEGPFSGYPAFVSPPQVAQDLRDAGYDSCSTASNHSLDAGSEGIQRTLGAMDDAGLAHAGSARTKAESRQPALLKAGSASIAQLSYTYDTNGYPMPKGQPWAVNLIKKERIIADARAARKAGADVVVVSMHWGTEWQEEPDAQQLKLGRALTGSRSGGRPDIDLILGTHAHVPQPYEKVNGTWIVYGMGDQIAGKMVNHSGAYDPRGNWSTLARFTFAPPKAKGQRWDVSKAEFIPQLMDQSDGAVPRVVNLGEEGAGYEDVRDRLAEIALSRGGAEDGLVMGG